MSGARRWAYPPGFHAHRAGDLSDVMILLDPRARPVIGHRGNRAHAPENTLESLQQAVALGVDAVEFDLRVSRDGALVVMHDETLERTTDGSGPIASKT